MATENAIVSANWRNKIPVFPGNNATGTNTATSTSEVATTAPATSFIATEAALCGSVMPSAMCRSTFSFTTSPVASVMPNNVNVLIENPNALIKMKVPTSDTGMVIAGMNVLRQSCKNKKMTIITNAIACNNVIITSRIDSLTTLVVSKAIAYFSPGGNVFESFRNSALAALSTSSAFAPGSCVTPMPTASWPLNRNREL